MTPNELDLSFPTPNYCAKFHQILFKIATVGAMTDRHTDRQTPVILLSAPCYAIAMGQIKTEPRDYICRGCKNMVSKNVQFLLGHPAQVCARIQAKPDCVDNVWQVWHPR